MKTKTRKIIASAIGCALGLAAIPASAVSYTLTYLNTAGYAGPYGTVDVQLSGNTATITFTGLNGYMFGDGSSVGVNVNGSYANATIITDTDFKDFTSSPPPVDGIGSYNLIVDDNNFSTPQSTISFSITGSWASAADVLALNASGYLAEGHVLIPGTGGLTGFAAGGNTPSTVPDGGSTVALLGVAMLGIGSVRRFVQG